MSKFDLKHKLKYIFVIQSVMIDNSTGLHVMPFLLPKKTIDKPNGWKLSNIQESCGKSCLNRIPRDQNDKKGLLEMTWNYCMNHALKLTASPVTERL